MGGQNRQLAVASDIMADHAAVPTKPQRGEHLKSNTTPAALHTGYHMTSAQ